jgi:hypothetical protein
VRLRAAAVAAVLGAAAAAVPSYGVQTSRFSLTTGDGRTAIVHAPGDGAVRDEVQVANRSDETITLRLEVVGATRRPDGNFALGRAGEGLAGSVTLAATSLRLAPRESRDVAMTVDRPASVDADEYAAVTAVEVSPDDPGGFAVTERLALLVGITEDAPAEPGSSGRDGGSDVLRWVLVAVAGALVLGGAVSWTRRRTATGR